VKPPALRNVCGRKRPTRTNVRWTSKAIVIYQKTSCFILMNMKKRIYSTLRIFGLSQQYDYKILILH
jgi:hypothetical protein